MKILFSLLFISSLGACTGNSSNSSNEDSNTSVSDQSQEGGDLNLGEGSNYKTGTCTDDVFADSNAVIEFCRPTTQRSFVEMEKNRIETLQCRLEVESFLAKYPNAACTVKTDDGSTLDMSETVSHFTAIIEKFKEYGF